MANMLTAYRRHQKTCPHREEGRRYRRCRCPIWADGILSGQVFRKSVDTRNWEVATARIRDWEFDGRVTADEPTQIAIAGACTRFMADAESRSLSRGTLKKYQALLTQLEDFAAGAGLRYLHQLDVDWLRKFREHWKDSPISATKKIERLRSVSRFWHEAGWITANYAKKIKAPKITAPPTLPFSRDELVSLIEAIGRLGGTDLSRARMHALILLLRYSGLRIGDAVRLHESRIDGRLIRLYTQKTGTHVHVPVPDFVIARLDELPRHRGFYFGTGQGSAATAAGNYRRAFRRLRELAGLPKAHPHQFRDTFACELLQAGVSMENVSKLLGHRSQRITEKHYAPWVKGRQEQLERDVERTWAGEAEPAPAAKVVKFRKAG